MSRRERLRAGLRGLTGLHLGRARTHDLVERGDLGPLADPASLPPGFWERRRPLHGVDLDGGRSLDFLERELAPFFGEFEDAGIDTANGWFESVDAEVAFAMLRRLRPARVLELGSGHSTHVLAAALSRNAGDGERGTLITVDPQPRRDLPTGVELRRARAQDLPLTELASLADSDVLFVDTSHTVKPGNEVVWLVSEVLPVLAAGVHVHFHDIYLPGEYPRVLIDDLRLPWAEQYLLEAYLANNADYEIVFGSQAAVRADRARLERAVPSFTGANSPNSLWLRRT